MPSLRAADPGSNWWQFWRDEAPEIKMTIDVSGDGSAAEIGELVNRELARVLDSELRFGPLLHAGAFPGGRVPS